MTLVEGSRFYIAIRLLGGPVWRDEQYRGKRQMVVKVSVESSMPNYIPNPSDLIPVKPDPIVTKVYLH